VRLGRYLGYASGDVGNNLTFSLASAFLLIYYTDVAGISASTAGTLFLVVRIWAGVADLIAGQVVDRTNTRWGRFRPYLVGGSVPLLLLLIAVFTIPSGLSDGAKVGGAFVSYALFNLAYSFVNIPYGSLAAAMTQDPSERARLSTARTMAASLTILLIAVVVSPQLSGGGDLQRSLTMTTVAFAVVAFGLYLWCFATSKETAARQVAPTRMRETFAMLRHNRPLVVLCGSTLVFLTGQFAIQTVAVYYARDVLGDADLYIVMTVVQTVGMIGAAAAVPAIAGVLGKKRAYLASALLTAAAGLGVALAPGSIPAVGIAVFGVLGFGLGILNTLTFALQADTVDYGEWQSGVRAEGSSYAVLSFTRKFGQAVGGAAAAWTIGIGGYVSGASDQTDGAVWSIRIASGVLPAVAILGATAGMLAYPLTEEVFRRIVAETAQRRASETSAAPPT
jgi:glucuronide carrier protein